jgi:hypothetical protein
MRSAIIASAFILAGCQTVFVPAYSEDIHGQLASTSEDLQRIQVMLQDTQHHSAADLEPTFVDTLTHLGQASAAANARAQSGGTPFARRSGAIIAANVTRCEDGVRGALAASREGTLDAGAFQRMFVVETCNFPKMEEELLQR